MFYTFDLIISMLSSTYFLDYSSLFYNITTCSKSSFSATSTPTPATLLHSTLLGSSNLGSHAFIASSLSQLAPPPPPRYHSLLVLPSSVIFFVLALVLVLVLALAIVIIIFTCYFGNYFGFTATFYSFGFVGSSSLDFPTWSFDFNNWILLSALLLFCPTQSAEFKLDGCLKASHKDQARLMSYSR